MISISLAKPSDDDTIVGLLLTSFAHLYARMGLDMSPEREAYLKDQAYRRSFATVLMVEVDGETVGTVALVPPGPQSAAWVAGAWDLRLLAVAPGMQGRGIARQLITAAEDVARFADAPAMCLHARRGIPNQARLYLAAGYRRAPVGDVDGEPFLEGYRKYL